MPGLTTAAGCAAWPGEEEGSHDHDGARPRAGSLLPGGAHLIGPDWVPAVSGDTIEVINPATGEVLLRVPRGRAADIDAAVTAAADAFPAWRDTSPAVRAELLHAWARLCREHETQLAALESLEVGHPYWGPSPVARTLVFVAGMADKVTGQTLPSAQPDVLGLTIREPYGVCGCIIPWNVPGPIMVTDVAPAIATGNTIVVKPAEDAPLTCLLLAKLALEAGIPPGVVNVVTGYGPEAGAALPAHPLVRRIGFTGSPETGTKIMEACAAGLVPAHGTGRQGAPDRAGRRGPRPRDPGHRPASPSTPARSARRARGCWSGTTGGRNWSSGSPRRSAACGSARGTPMSRWGR